MIKDELITVFRTLGARDPEEWAQSEIEEGIPQLARFLFLKGCWDRIVLDGDTEWIDNLLNNVPESSDDPYAGGAHAMRRMIDAGAAKEDISELVRASQAEFLAELCYLMEDSYGVDGNKDYVNWAFVSLDEDDNPVQIIGGLHESVLETDPTGREMRPTRKTSS